MPTFARKQHFVPQFLLRAWASDSKQRHRIWVFDKRLGRARLQRIADTATQTDYYEVLLERGSLEAQLSRVEGLAAPTIRSISEQHGLHQLDELSKHNLSLFIAL